MAAIWTCSRKRSEIASFALTTTFDRRLARFGSFSTASLQVSGMRVGVIRAGGRPTVGADAGAIAPGLDVTALPDSAAGAFGVMLGRVISSPGVLRPVQCQPVSHEPFA